MVIAQADRCAARRLTVLVSLALISSGCGVLVSTPTPGPTELEPAAGTQMEVAVDNRSDESFTMTVSQGAEPGPAYLTVGPCEAANFTYPMVEPFTVGFGKAADFVDRPMPELVASEQLEILDGGYRLLIRVAANGEVGFGPLEGVALLRGAGC